MSSVRVFASTERVDQYILIWGKMMKQKYYVDVLDGDAVYLDTVQSDVSTVDEAFSEARHGLVDLAIMKLRSASSCELSARVRDADDRFLCRFSITVSMTKSCSCADAPPASFLELKEG